MAHRISANAPAPAVRPTPTDTDADWLHTMQAEQHNTDHPLMTCRYCLLNELGHCRKQSPLRNEPKYLRLRNNTIVQLTFDCKNCQMLISKI